MPGRWPCSLEVRLCERGLSLSEDIVLHLLTLPLKGDSLQPLTVPCEGRASLFLRVGADIRENTAEGDLSSKWLLSMAQNGKPVIVSGIFNVIVWDLGGLQATLTANVEPWIRGTSAYRSHSSSIPSSYALSMWTVQN